MDIHGIDFCICMFMELISVFAVINAVSRRYFLQANDVTDMRDWVSALNRASKITVSGTHIPARLHGIISTRVNYLSLIRDLLPPELRKLQCAVMQLNPVLRGCKYPLTQLVNEEILNMQEYERQ